MSSCLPSRISLKPRMVSESFTYFPAVPVNCSATKNGWDKNFWIFRARATVSLSSSDKFFHAQNGNDILQDLCISAKLSALRAQLHSALRRQFSDQESSKRNQADQPPDKFRVPKAARDNTTVESRCPKVVAGAGSVRSSAGT